MKLTDLIHKGLITHQFTIGYINAIDLQADDIGVLAKDAQENFYKLTINEKVIKIEIKDTLSKQDLDFQLYRNNANLAQVAWVQDDLVELKIFFFSGDVIYLPDVQIGVTDNAMNEAKKRKMYNIKALSNGLESDCVLQANGDTYICARIAMHDSYDDDNQETKTNSGQNDIHHEMSKNYTNDSVHSITIYGANYRLPILKKKLLKGIDTDSKLLLSTVEPNKNKDNTNYQLIRVKLSWIEESESKAISDYAKSKLDTLISDNSSYFKVWENYVQKEIEILQKKIDDIGNITILSTELCEQGIRIYTNKDFGKLLKSGDNGDVLEILESQSDISDNINNEESLSKKNSEKLTKVLAIKESYIEVDNVNINKSNGLKLSIYGNKIQIERRQKARERVLTGRSANPNLGLIIEGADNIPIPQKPLRQLSLNPEIEKKIFKYGATPTQKKAVELALNTPDIMLIQGPPGTGKTTVITAILEQLNVNRDKKSEMAGTVLISAFQHDAVDNLSDRLTVNDIPVIKFSSNDEHKYRNLDRVSQWANEIAHHIDEQQPCFDSLMELKIIDDLADTYKLSPSHQQAIKLLNQIQECKVISLSRESEKKINDILKELNTPVQEKSELTLARSIRLTKSGYLDDGLIILLRVKDRFGDILTEKSYLLLDKILSQELSIDEVIVSSRIIKKELIDILKPKPQFSLSKPRKDILQLLDEIKSIGNKYREHTDKKEQILFDLRNELLSNPYGVSKSLERYNTIYASTVQQSDGKQIRLAKKTYNETDYVDYETVIVDEAARVGAMDLLIPMSQAKNRIILVGDHRQLPHMIEEELVHQVAQDESFDGDMAERYLKESIFAYLFNLLKEMEKKDGIIRTITLDAQYRSHPLLGKFASDCFYQPYGEGYVSPIKADAFQHQLMGIENKSAIWLNVPHHLSEKKETKNGTSRYRRLEVDKIVDKLIVWLNSEEGQELTFGVISFYSAQVDLIKEALKEALKEKGIDLEYINHEKERLRIGSVDAFQGMEFDIVFLSMVRTKSMDKLSLINANDKKIQTQFFGHLMSKNRLCVAVTRQKRALIMVGNAELAKSEIGKQAVPELGKFYELCASHEQGVVL